MFNLWHTQNRDRRALHWAIANTDFTRARKRETLPETGAAKTVSLRWVAVFRHQYARACMTVSALGFVTGTGPCVQALRAGVWCYALPGISRL